MALIRTNPVRHGDQAGDVPEHRFGLRWALWQGTELRLELVHQPQRACSQELAPTARTFSKPSVRSLGLP